MSVLWSTIVVLAAVLVVYSQTAAFGWDEGFHLIAAWLIALGKQPYRDFMFAQTPLNAYWNALIMRVGGIGWRGPHAAAAIETAAAAGITADYLLRRLPAASRLWISVAVAMLIGTNIILVEFANIAQAYAMCIFMSALAFRFAVSSVGGRSWPAAFSGAAAGAAAASSLLSAPLGPVLFVWLLLQGGGRRAAAYSAGAVVGLSPAILAFVKWRSQFLFGVVDFQMHFRQVDWDGWLVHDIEIVTGFLNSVQGLVLLSLALAGVLAARRSKDLMLCCWISAVSTIYLASTHPTFPQYFIVEMPFAAILAGAGLQALFDRYPHRWPAIAVAALMVASLGRSFWEERDDTSWADLRQVAETVEKVLKPDMRLYAEEQTYLLTGRIPPPGMEWSSSHKIKLPLAQAKGFHVIPQPELDRQVKHGDFPVLETCEETEVTRLGMESLYEKEQKVKDCFVFSDFKKP